MKIFSLPINPKLNEEYVNTTFIPFLIEHKHLIFDLYFTCRMPPFLQDAMGDTFVNDIREPTYNALYISEQSGIPLSATFNNIYVIPSQENLNTFIENFKPLYEAGVRIATIPHTSWLLTGQIQKEFPDLYIKNTILREVTKPNEIVSLAKAGFHYINLDRDLMRDKDSLLRIKEAKDYCFSIDKPIKISLLANEGCWGGCPIMPEHYHYNNTRRPNNPQYFNDPISRVSCSKWDEEDSATALKAANLPPWKSDWEEFLDIGIDVFKMHGRESAMRLRESMDIIERWNQNETLLFPQFDKYINDISLKERPIDVWRDKIKNCKFDCWKCNYCDSVINTSLKKSDRNLNVWITRTLESIDKAGKDESSFDESILVSSLSSNKIKHFLNNLCSYSNSIYLELGTYTGSTFYAATENNPILAFAVDNFEQKDIKPFRDDVKFIASENPEQEFLSRFRNPRWNFIKKDIRDITNKDLFNKPNVIFYDADHNYEEQLDNLNHLLPHLDDEFVLVIDDANFDGVVESADEFISSNNLDVIFQRKILTSIPEDSSSWWNGIFVMVIRK